ncbi:MAG: GNAT family N-acetyltransferase, partial [Oscillospiraceae bacterium]
YILDECNINRIAVLPTFRRQHLGLAFLTELFSFCRMHHLFRIGLEVRASNLPAQNLYRSCGFFSIGERKNLYANPTENGIIMEKILEEAAHE